jgi:hypothetical protein
VTERRVAVFTNLFWRKVGLDFARTFVATFLVAVLPVWEAIAAGDWNAGKAAGLAAVASAVSASIRAAQARFTQLETPTEPPEAKNARGDLTFDDMLARLEKLELVARLEKLERYLGRAPGGPSLGSAWSS